jgi:ribose transport system substrate-binding protein
MRKVFWGSLLAALLLASCQKDKEKPADGKLVIAVIPKGTTHEFWKTVHAGAVKAAREFGVEVIWKGPLKEDDREAQIKVVEDFISRGVSGMVLAPLDDSALRVPVTNAARSGIPVVIIDSDLKSEDYTSFVATDNLKGGVMAGEKLAELVHDGGKVMMLRYSEGSASTMNREQGFLEAMSRHPGTLVVSSNRYGGVTTESAYQASENLLAQFKTGDGALSVNGIFCPNESSTFGMLRALQDGGYAGKVRFVGFDSSAKLVEALQNKEIDALVLQNPMLMGYLGVKTMVMHLRGQEVPKRIDTGVTVVTRDNMDRPEIKELLSPDLTKWLNE